MAQLPGRGQIRHHQGQRFVRAPLAQAQQGHAAGGAGVTGQLETAQALEGQQTAVPQQEGRPRHGIPHGRCRRQGLRAGPVRRGAVRGQGAARRQQGIVHQPQARSALRAGHGLGVEAPVQRIAVLGLAAGTEGEAGHAGGSTVVGDGTGDGVARPAIGAIGEGIAEARIAGRAHVAQAVLADAHIGADQHAVAGMAVAGHDDEFRLAVHRGQLRDLQPGEPCQGRQLTAQAHGKGIHLRRVALHLDAHPLRGVAHAAGKAAFHGQPVDEGAEAHALDLSCGQQGRTFVLCHGTNLAFFWRLRYARPAALRGHETL